jgi:lambda family phage minor tail protein L
MTTYSEELRKLNQSSGIVELYRFDATAIGGTVYHLTPTPSELGVITFNGVTYTCFPLSSFGWEVSTSGTMPRPTLQVSNVTQTFLSAIVSLGDLVGMEVQRFFTFQKYLDGQPEADPSKKSVTELYFVEQKVQHDAQSITWQLASPLDRANTILPRRQYLKDETTHNVYAPGLSRYRGAY